MQTRYNKPYFLSDGLTMPELTDLTQQEAAGTVAETLDFWLYECSIDEAPAAAEVAQWRDILPPAAANSRGWRKSAKLGWMKNAHDAAQPLQPACPFVAGRRPLFAAVSRSGGRRTAFAHFDKVAHFALFSANSGSPPKPLCRRSAPFPMSRYSPWPCSWPPAAVAQALFTQSRQGDLLDGLADIAGAATALWLAHKVSAAKKQAV